jgi:hypothetical protein
LPSATLGKASALGKEEFAEYLKKNTRQSIRHSAKKRIPVVMVILCSKNGSTHALEMPFFHFFHFLRAGKMASQGQLAGGSTLIHRRYKSLPHNF